MLLAAPLGGQEHANRNWLLSKDAALDAGDPATLNRRLEDLPTTGELCRIAWNAYSRLERNGSERIIKVVGMGNSYQRQSAAGSKKCLACERILSRCQ
jgi:hypothetical protein